MYYVKNISKERKGLERKFYAGESGRMDEKIGKPIWSVNPIRLNREGLVRALMSIPICEELEITTNHFTS